MSLSLSLIFYPFLQKIEIHYVQQIYFIGYFQVLAITYDRLLA